jgi:hypothetical protein
MKRIRLLALLVLVAGCFDSVPGDGAVMCSSDPNALCPAGFYCAADHHCWKKGSGPDLDDERDAVVDLR